MVFRLKSKRGVILLFSLLLLFLDYGNCRESGFVKVEQHQHHQRNQEQQKEQQPLMGGDLCSPIWQWIVLGFVCGGGICCPVAVLLTSKYYRRIIFIIERAETRNSSNNNNNNNNDVAGSESSPSGTANTTAASSPTGVSEDVSLEQQLLPKSSQSSLNLRREQQKQQQKRRENEESGCQFIMEGEGATAAAASATAAAAATLHEMKTSAKSVGKEGKVDPNSKSHRTGDDDDDEIEGGAEEEEECHRRHSLSVCELQMPEKDNEIDSNSFSCRENTIQKQFTTSPTSPTPPPPLPPPSLTIFPSSSSSPRSSSPTSISPSFLSSILRQATTAAKSRGGSTSSPSSSSKSSSHYSRSKIGSSSNSSSSNRKEEEMKQQSRSELWDDVSLSDRSTSRVSFGGELSPSCSGGGGGGGGGGGSVRSFGETNSSIKTSTTATTTASSSLPSLNISSVSEGPKKQEVNRVERSKSCDDVVTSSNQSFSNPLISPFGPPEQSRFSSSESGELVSTPQFSRRKSALMRSPRIPSDGDKDPLSWFRGGDEGVYNSPPALSSSIRVRQTFSAAGTPKTKAAGEVVVGINASSSTQQEKGSSAIATTTVAQRKPAKITIDVPHPEDGESGKYSPTTAFFAAPLASNPHNDAGSSGPTSPAEYLLYQRALQLSSAPQSPTSAAGAPMIITVPHHPVLQQLPSYRNQSPPVLDLTFFSSSSSSSKRQTATAAATVHFPVDRNDNRINKESGVTAAVPNTTTTTPTSQDVIVENGEEEQEKRARSNSSPLPPPLPPLITPSSSSNRSNSFDQTEMLLMQNTPPSSPQLMRKTSTDSRSERASFGFGGGFVNVIAARRKGSGSWGSDALTPGGNNNNNNNPHQYYCNSPSASSSNLSPRSNLEGINNNNNNEDMSKAARTPTPAAATPQSPFPSSSSSVAVWGGGIQRVASPCAMSAEIRWRRGELLGVGSSGRVYAALEQDTGLLMAVKEISFNKQDVGLLKEVANEVNIMKKLKHPNIVQYYGTDADTSHGVLFVFMEFVPGGSLLSIISEFGPLEEKLIKVYVEQILHGLVYLHENMIVHRDIKAANILIDDLGNAKLTDFGSSAQLSANESVVISSSIKGTPCCMAPEAMSEQVVSFKGDIWSLGCTIVHMITGDFPWACEKFEHPVAAFLHITKANSGPFWPRNAVSAALNSFLESCFQRIAENRPCSIDLVNHPWLREEQQSGFEEQETKDGSNRFSGEKNDNSVSPVVRGRVQIVTTTSTPSSSAAENAIYFQQQQQQQDSPLPSHHHNFPSSRSSKFNWDLLTDASSELLSPLGGVGGEFEGVAWGRD